MLNFKISNPNESQQGGYKCQVNVNVNVKIRAPVVELLKIVASTLLPNLSFEILNTERYLKDRHSM